MKITYCIALYSVAYLAACSQIQPPAETKPQDLDWSKVYKYGGPKISIASDVGSWKITKKIFSADMSDGKSVRFKSDDYHFKCSPKQIDGAGVEGDYALAAKQTDGKWIVGTYEWIGCPRSGVFASQNLNNFAGNSVFLKAFGLKEGSEVCFFFTSLSRDHERNGNERSNMACTKWHFVR